MNYKNRTAETAGYNTSLRVLKLIDHVWRLFATVLGFTIFGVGGLIMGLILFPLMFVFIRDTERRSVRARRLIGKAFGGFWGLIKILGVLDYRIEGREHIDIHGNQLVVANHPTLIDVVILISLFPRANCVIKEAVTKNVFMRNVVRAANYLSNSAPEDLLESCVSYLEKGGSLMLFPEGTRTEQGKVMKFKPGAATVAARSGVDVLPVVIRCEPLFQSKELPWFFVPNKRPAFTISVLAPMGVEDLTTVDAGEREMRHELNNNLLAHMRRELTSVEFSE
jgi:1-acyl-sn-glycerol-3-phosphate acyltransferase